jgi:hypothetical protein
MFSREGPPLGAAFAECGGIDKQGSGGQAQPAVGGRALIGRDFAGHGRRMR